MARKTILTPELAEIICKAIRQGAYDYVAAEAAGIGQRTFYDWLERGAQPDADPLFAQFSQSVEQARADARMAAEKRVLDEQPATWLLKGPGRERPGRPGWSNETTVNVQAGDTPVKLKWADSEGE